MASQQVDGSGSTGHAGPWGKPDLCGLREILMGPELRFPQPGSTRGPHPSARSVSSTAEVDAPRGWLPSVPVLQGPSGEYGSPEGNSARSLRLGRGGKQSRVPQGSLQGLVCSSSAGGTAPGPLLWAGRGLEDRKAISRAASPVLWGTHIPRRLR